ncbi:hypothetical protein JK635_02220 [Neobacillus sp. YIM B02564]|uniref:Uncharacterized protein n=1 Tax=Neobacillus paridis TaxID=2803862 RepID=A0ABS1TIA1_9BACI|nr:hypothetical protein [Neobacillus paridis]MBL4951055.1 hypothetical protein [Neobacillus paridis]
MTGGEGRQMLILKIIFLFLAILYGLDIVIKSRYKNTIYASQLVLMTIGIVGFIVLQFLI